MICGKKIPPIAVGKQKSGSTHVKRNTHFVRPEGEAGEGETGERLCERGPCKSESYDDGGLFRNAEGALLHAADQSEDEDDGDPVYLLRDPHGQRSIAGKPVGEAGADRML